MSNLIRDATLYKKALLCVLAAGSGAILYIGYTRWKQQREEESGNTPNLQSEKQLENKQSEPKEEPVQNEVQEEQDKAVESPLIQFDTPGVSRTSSVDTNQDSLSLSGSFEKVSLSALKEQLTPDESVSGQKSPSESFEKVSLPPVSPVSKDAPAVNIQPTGTRVKEVIDPPGRKPTTDETSSSPTSDLSSKSKSTAEPTSASSPMGPGDTISPQIASVAKAAPQTQAKTEMKIDLGGPVKQMEAVESIKSTVTAGTKTGSPTNASSDGAGNAPTGSSQPSKIPRSSNIGTDQMNHHVVEDSLVSNTGLNQNMNGKYISISEANPDRTGSDAHSILSKHKSKQNKQENKTNKHAQVDPASTTSSNNTQSSVQASPVHIVHTLVSEQTGRNTTDEPLGPGIDDLEVIHEEEFQLQYFPESPKVSYRKGSMTSSSSTSSFKDLDNVFHTLRRLKNCFSDLNSTNRLNLRIVLGHPAHPVEHIDLGMSLRNPASGGTGHMVGLVDPRGLAREIGLRGGEEIIGVNDMIVTGWRPDVLLLYIAMLSVTTLQLMVKSVNTMGQKSINIQCITANLDINKSGVALKSVTVTPITDRLSPPIELGEFTPKVCFIQFPGNGGFLKLSGSRLMVVPKDDEDSSFEMMRLLFSRTRPASFQVPVTMLAFCAKDILHYMSTVNTNQVSLMSQKNLFHDVETLKTADCRFFHHRFVGGLDCFEATQLPDHYLSCDGHQVSLKYVKSSKQVAADPSVQFTVHYTAVPSEEISVI